MAEADSTVLCDGCEKDLDVLRPYLSVQIKAQREVFQPATDDPFEADADSEVSVQMGTQSGRGRILKLHNFSCLSKYANADERKGKSAKIMPHEEDEIYVPEDNRSPEELVADGELPKEILGLHKALAKDSETDEGDR